MSETKDSNSISTISCVEGLRGIKRGLSFTTYQCRLSSAFGDTFYSQNTRAANSVSDLKIQVVSLGGGSVLEQQMTNTCEFTGCKNQSR